MSKPSESPVGNVLLKLGLGGWAMCVLAVKSERWPGDFECFNGIELSPLIEGIVSPLFVNSGGYCSQWRDELKNELFFRSSGVCSVFARA